MQLLSIAITLVVVVLVSAMILKKYKPHAILLGGGIVLLLSAQFLGINNIITDVEKSTGFWLFDVFELMRTTLQKDAGATGMVIMAAGAYAMFMNHVGASDVMVKICTKPLKHLGSPYIVLALTYTVGQLLNIFVPSAAGLSVLLMATVYPVLIALGVSHLSAAAVIASAACLDLGPASGASNMAAEMAGLEPMTYFIKYQVPIMVVVIPLVTVTHYLVQKYFDKKDGFVANKNDTSAQEDDTTAAGVPKFYALLPLFPLVLLLLFNELVITSIKMNVVTAMMMGVCLTIILEVIRKPKHAFDSVKIIDVFFGGMGKQFANIITLIMSGEIFAEGLKRMGMIDLIIEGAQNIGFGPIPMTIVMVAIIMISAIIMGSGAAPFYAFIALAPTVSESFGIHPVIMCLAMQLATGMGRNMSPISSCMVATAGCTDGKVLSVDLVKRTVIPMFVGAVGLILGDVIFFM